jgi:putative redox protein
MGKDTERSVHLERTAPLQFRVINRQGSSMIIGNGDLDAFSPVDLLLAAIAGCTAMDVDAITGKRAEPEHFEVDIRADKIKDAGGNRLVNVEINFQVRFPDSEAGAAAAAVLPVAARKSHDRLCVVSRSVELPTPFTVRIVGSELSVVD